MQRLAVTVRKCSELYLTRHREAGSAAEAISPMVLHPSSGSRPRPSSSYWKWLRKMFCPPLVAASAPAAQGYRFTMYDRHSSSPIVTATSIPALRASMGGGLWE